MDYFLMLRYLLVVTTACMTVEAVARTVSLTDVLQASIKSAGKHSRTQRTRHGHIEDNSIDPETETEQTEPCCLNGGICIMNAFCHCRKNYYGRRCEHRERHRKCGTLRHGTWMAVSCHMCHCFDGKITCKTSTIPGCENSPYAEGHDTEPDYNVAYDTKTADYDRFYDDYEEHVAPTSAAASSPVSLATNVHALVIVAMVTRLLYKTGS